jgi:muconolactone delta-isomerase
MKYVVSWSERPQGSPAEYENAQKRILGTFRHWKMPESLNVQQFLVRVGDYGGYLVIETEDVRAVHKLTSAFPAFRFRVDSVLDIGEAVPVELEAIAWRDSVRM